MKERIEEILSKYQLSSAQFADIIGVQRSSISHILSGRNKPSFDFIQKILHKYPKINAHWLITGLGNPEGSLASSGLGNNSKEEKDLFTQDTDIKRDTINDHEVSEYNKSVNLNNKPTVADSKNNLFTNVNKVKSIIYIYEDDSFKILNSR